MTAVAEQTESTEAEGGVGRVARVIGPVVDVEFSVDTMPDIYNALQVDVTLSGEEKMLTLEVAQHLGDNLVRAISMQPTPRESRRRTRSIVRCTSRETETRNVAWTTWLGETMVEPAGGSSAIISICVCTGSGVDGSWS